MRAALHFESEKRQRHMALLKAPLKQPKTTTLQVRLNEEVSGGGSGLSIREQHCLAAERIAEKRMECNRFATGTAQPISLRRRVTVDSDEQSFGCHVGLYAPDGPSGIGTFIRFSRGTDPASTAKREWLGRRGATARGRCLTPAHRVRSAPRQRDGPDARPCRRHLRHPRAAALRERGQLQGQHLTWAESCPA